MKNRRTFLMMLTVGVVALGVIVAPVIADELFGEIIAVDVDGKKLTVLEKGADKEIEIKINDDTEVVTKKGSQKVDLEKLSRGIEKAKEKGKKGIRAKITHKKGVASKIEPARKKEAQNQDN